MKITARLPLDLYELFGSERDADRAERGRSIIIMFD